MRQNGLKVFLVAGAALLACDDGVNTTQSGGGASNAGNAGMSTSTAGVNGTQGGAGTVNVGGEAGTVAEGGTAQGGTGQAGTAQGGSGGAQGGNGAGGTADAGESGAAGTSTVDLLAVVPSSACGVATAPDDGTYQIAVSGTKTDCAHQPCIGDWTDSRDYSIFKPEGYVNTTPYMLVFEGPGCGGDSTSIYPYDNNANDTIIRIGLRPSQNVDIQAGHGTNPNQGCFDDKEGDDSVDFVLYENLYDLLDTQLCFDRNRVFAGGNSSGAWLANELGCKYAGDADRPIRGVMPNAGGLPDQPQFAPTCTDSSMAGFWVFEVGDSTHPFNQSAYAINRALSANCPGSFLTYDSITREDYPIGGGNADDVCQRLVDEQCDPLTPMVVCALNGTGHGSHDPLINPGVATFLQSFLAPPLAGP